jgi:hypothetical protein
MNENCQLIASVLFDQTLSPNLSILAHQKIRQNLPFCSIGSPLYVPELSFSLNGNMGVYTTVMDINIPHPTVIDNLDSECHCNLAFHR